MSYTINLPNGTTLGTIADGTIDNTHTSLTLVGRNYSNYGQIISNDLIALLVNFAYNVNPSNPQAGQLWYDTTTNNSRLKLYTGSEWKNVGSCTSQSSAPITTVAGDLWWDSGNQQLYVYNGTSPYNVAGWILVGPQRNGSGAVWEQLYDTGNNPHDVLSIKLDGVRTAVISADTFTSNTSITGIGTAIRAGYNVSSVYTIYGTANNASYLGFQPAANYFRNDLNNLGTGSLTLTSNAGIILGSLSNFSANVNGTDGSGRLYNTFSGGNVSFYVNATTGGVTRGLYVSGSDGKAYVGVDPTSALGVASKQYVDNRFINANLWGVSTAVTAPTGTANTWIATTEWVTNNSGFLKNKIYDSVNTYIAVNDTGAGNALVVIDGSIVATADSAGFNLQSGATAITQSQDYTSTGSSSVATTQYVKTASAWWGNSTHRSAKIVSTDAPVLGVNDSGSHDGDFWFQIAI